MKRIIWFQIALYMAAFLFPLLGISETETLLTEERLAQFGEETCDAARFLASRNIAVVSDVR